jgi:hypothetical protein
VNSGTILSLPQDSTRDRQAAYTRSCSHGNAFGAPYPAPVCPSVDVVFGSDMTVGRYARLGEDNNKSSTYSYQPARIPPHIRLGRRSIKIKTDPKALLGEFGAG